MTKQKVMALGFFDGIHVGHAALINKIKQRAEETGAEPAVLTFDVHPDNLVFKKSVPLINSAEDRENILSRCFGIDDVVVIHFNQRVMHMDWRDFIDELIDEMNLRWIVVGHDFCIRPTVSDSGNVNVESFLLDFRGNLYGHRARIDFYKFLRPERKFDDVAELAAQIKNDAQTTREYFENNA